MITGIRSFLKKSLNQKQYLQIKRLFPGLLSLPYVNNLNKLALIYKTDKYGHHYYTEHYARHFKNLRFKRLKIFEIGVGGYNHSDIGAAP